MKLFHIAHIMIIAVFCSPLFSQETDSESNTTYGILAGNDLNTPPHATKIAHANSLFGKNAGGNIQYDGANSIFGVDAGIAMNGDGNANNNSFFGARAGYLVETGSNNSYIGVEAGQLNTNGERNSFLGTESGSNAISGDENTFIGATSGINMRGDRNTFLGYNTAVNMTFGSNNVVIGSNAGPPAGPPGGLTSFYHSLYIDIKQTAEPLISGTFGGNGFDPSVTINGEFEATGGVASSSDINVKHDIIPVDEHDILDKVRRLDISEWSYNTIPGVRHVGPMAQDFRAAFGLGKDDTTISTLDADGVALAAIKALAEENAALKLENEEIKLRLVKIEAMLNEK